MRNSDAHAWAEVYDAQTGGWLRADALAAPVEAVQGPEAKTEEAIAARSDRSWSARLDSLRVFWYRRIVSFDGRSQLETLKEVKDAAQSTSRHLRETLAEAIGVLKDWLSAPWSLKRGAKLVALLAGLIAAAWAIRRHSHEVWARLAGRSAKHRDDPVRAAAGRWLVRLRDAAEKGERGEKGTGPIEVSSVVGDLQRLRFGAQATWTEPESVFRRARQTWHTVKRRVRAQ